MGTGQGDEAGQLSRTNPQTDERATMAQDMFEKLDIKLNGPHELLIASGYRGHATILAYLDFERPGRSIPGDGSEEFGEPGILDVEMHDVGVDDILHEIGVAAAELDIGLHVWHGHVRSRRVEYADGEEWEIEYSGGFRAATQDDLRRFNVELFGR